ncbi:MAG: DUF1801 domain-containing protein [Gammaproteobacteria bacterium]|nr:DUF1801 domain-containing protein [Gammaproteobacteria bacterium]NNC57485.1 DUF1801 domain-containing protein [Woeseiaceae bacterium]NNL51805.1 DUF1801 domain-containing protein [Woeseiaceae bacterium]
MAENKTKPNKASVTAFLNGIEDERKRRDAKKVAAMMREATGSRAKMWGANIVGFGEYHYKYASGREGDFMITGFSPRKQALTLYVIPGFKHFETMMNKLGKYKTGRSCLYIKHLSDIDEKVLKRLIVASVKHMRKNYETK